MNTLRRNSHSSAFRELRLAGYTQHQIAKFLNVARNTVMLWDEGSLRPRWRYMPGLAKLFKIDLAEAVRKFWDETVGDPCPCGCGGEKVFPDRGGARHLYIHLPCEQCEKPRPPYRTMQGHRALCVSCSYASRKVERVSLTCVGYRPYPSVTIPIHAERCPLKKDFLPRELTNAKHKKDDGEGYPFADQEQGTCRCPFCAGAFRLLREREKNLKQQWEETHHDQNFPRIQSLDGLRDIQRQLTNPSTFNSENPKPTRGKDLPHLIHPAVPERKRKWRRENSSAPIQGLCGICDTLLFSYKKSRPMRFHQECLWNYQREHAADAAGPRNTDGTFTALTSKPIEERPRRGPPVQIESLQRHFAWTMRHKLLGDSLGEIAKDDEVTRHAVVKGIEFTLQHLPRPEWVRAAIRQRILALRSSADLGIQS